MTQFNDLLWHNKLHLNYQFGSNSVFVQQQFVTATSWVSQGFSVLRKPKHRRGGGGNVDLALLQHENQWQSCTDAFGDSQESGKRVYEACGRTLWLVIRQRKNPQPPPGLGRWKGAKVNQTWLWNCIRRLCLVESGKNRQNPFLPFMSVSIPPTLPRLCITIPAPPLLLLHSAVYLPYGVNVLL